MSAFIIKPELEKLLREYVSDESGKFQALLDGQREIASKLALVEVKIETQEARFTSMFRRQESRVDKLESKTDDTGRFHVDALTKQLEKHEQSKAHWVRYSVSTVVGIAIAVASGLISYLLTKGTR